jgi:hypothetical protein
MIKLVLFSVAQRSKVRIREPTESKSKYEGMHVVIYHRTSGTANLFLHVCYEQSINVTSESFYLMMDRYHVGALHFKSPVSRFSAEPSAPIDYYVPGDLSEVRVQLLCRSNII